MTETIEIDDDDFSQSQKSNFYIAENLPRNIIFFIDVSIQVNDPIAPSSNNGIKESNLLECSCLDTIKRYIKRYTTTNEMIGGAGCDKYAIALLKDKAIWWKELTTDVNAFNKSLDLLSQEVTDEYDSLDTQSIFDVTREHIRIFDNKRFTQAIVFYKRIDVLPTLAKDCTIRNLENFTMDVVFIHRRSDEKIQAIYDHWSKLDSKIVPGWYYETGIFYGIDNIAKALTQLLAHPLARGDQEHI